MSKNTPVLQGETGTITRNTLDEIDCISVGEKGKQ